MCARYLSSLHFAWRRQLYILASLFFGSSPKQRSSTLLHCARIRTSFFFPPWRQKLQARYLEKRNDDRTGEIKAKAHRRRQLLHSSTSSQLAFRFQSFFFLEHNFTRISLRRDFRVNSSGTLSASSCSSAHKHTYEIKYIHTRDSSTEFVLCLWWSQLRISCIHCS